MENTFARYRELYAESERLRIQSWDNMRELQNQLNTEILDVFRAKFPKRKVPEVSKAYEILGHEMTDPIYAVYRERNDSQHREIEDRRKAIEADMDAIAQMPDVMPETTSEMTQVDYVYSGVYRSQGFSVMKYAESAADTRAEIGLRHGLQVEKRRIGTEIECGYGIRIQDIGIFANTDAVGWDLVRRKPGMDLREWIKSCWRKGTNPRVYNPFLEHGLEEKLGIDYFGNDLVR